ncbi:MAG: hypothetical protein AAFO80_15780 [Pseudomonadota bacterium]
MIDFTDPDVLSHWLIGSAVRYGRTIVARPGGVDAIDNTDRFSLTQLREERERALSPVPYDVELDYPGCVIKEIGCSVQIAEREDFMLAATREAIFDQALSRALQSWEQEDGPAAIYLLLGIASERRLNDAPAIARMLLSKGWMTGFDPDWKRAIGHRIAVIAYNSATKIDSGVLFDTLPAKPDFWSYHSSGFVCVGTILHSELRQNRWKDIALKHLPDLTQFGEFALKQHLRKIVLSAQLGFVVRDSCFLIADLWGAEETRKPSRGDPRHRLLKLLYGSAIAPITAEPHQPRPMWCDHDKVTLFDVVREHDVARKFGKADVSDVMLICGARFEEITKTKRFSSGGPDAFWGALDSAMGSMPSWGDDVAETVDFERLYQSADLWTDAGEDAGDKRDA